MKINEQGIDRLTNDLLADIKDKKHLEDLAMFLGRRPENVNVRIAKQHVKETIKLIDQRMSRTMYALKRLEVLNDDEQDTDPASYIPF